MTDYNALAQKYGATSSIPPGGQKTDYSALAQKFGGVTQTAPTSPSPSTVNGWSDTPILGPLTDASIGIGSALGKTALGFGSLGLNAAAEVAPSFLPPLFSSDMKKKAQDLLRSGASGVDSLSKSIYDKPFEKSLQTPGGQVGTVVGTVAPYLLSAGAVNPATAELSAIPRIAVRTLPDVALSAAQSGGDAKTMLGTGLTSAVANTLLPGPLKGVAEKPIEGLFAGTKQFAKEVAPGYVSDVASGLMGQRGKDREGVNALIPGAGTALSTGIAATTRAYSGAKNLFTTEGQQNSIDKEFDTFVKSNKSIEKKANLFEKQRNVPVREILTEPDVYKGIKVENSKINPDEAIGTLQDRTDALMEAKKKILPELDRFTTPISKESVRTRAINDYKVTSLPLADQKEAIRAIDLQLAPYPDEMPISQWDDFRATMRKGARDARGIQKLGSEYSALENGSRDAVFSATDNLPFDTNGEFAALNDEIKKNIGTIEFLDKTLRGATTKGGRLGSYVARGVGAVIGSKLGIFGAIGGAEMGGAVSRIIQNNQMGSSLKMSLIKELTSDPKILQAAEEMLGKARVTNRPLLGAPTTPPGRISEIYTPIPVYPQGSPIEPVGRDTMISKYTPPNKAPGTAYTGKRDGIPLSDYYYTPNEKLPTIKAGTVPRKKSNLPTIKF